MIRTADVLNISRTNNTQSELFRVLTCFCHDTGRLNHGLYRAQNTLKCINKTKLKVHTDRRKRILNLIINLIFTRR